MENQIYLCNLYDYYSSLLTKHQKTCFTDYYFDNLTQEEIAEYLGISKNAVSKALKETKEKLEYYESSLHLLENKNKIVEILGEEEIKKIIDLI